jgi:catechol 2,3-dioxygenase-like lactoylglutathione lyase family enzyme
MRLNHVAIAVKDMENSLAFYRDAVGLAVIADAVISGPDLDIAVMETDARVRMVMLVDEAGTMIELLGWQSRPVRERPPEDLKFTSSGLVEVCLMVSDLKKLEKDLKKKGFKFRTPIWNFGDCMPGYDGPEVKVTHMVDPDGVQVELIQV